MREAKEKKLRETDVKKLPSMMKERRGRWKRSPGGASTADSDERPQKSIQRREEENQKVYGAEVHAWLHVQAEHMRAATKEK